MVTIPKDYSKEIKANEKRWKEEHERLNKKGYFTLEQIRKLVPEKEKDLANNNPLLLATQCGRNSAIDQVLENLGLEEK